MFLKSGPDIPILRPLPYQPKPDPPLELFGQGAGPSRVIVRPVLYWAIIAPGTVISVQGPPAIPPKINGGRFNGSLQHGLQRMRGSFEVQCFSGPGI